MPSQQPCGLHDNGTGTLEIVCPVRLIRTNVRFEIMNRRPQFLLTVFHSQSFPHLFANESKRILTSVWTSISMNCWSHRS